MKLSIWIILIITLLAVVPAFALPTYISSSVPNNHGTYGNTNIPTIINDETGKQIFDGDYGMFDWMYRAGVQSVDDYYARYEQQKGYGYPWVSWTPGYNWLATFDMGETYQFNSIGIHCYNRTSDTFPPSSITLNFSNDGSSYFNQLTTSFDNSQISFDSVCWRESFFQPVQARYVSINASGNLFLFVDEMSINGMDGAQFAASVPEPAGVLAVGTGLLGFLGIGRKKTWRLEEWKTRKKNPN